MKVVSKPYTFRCYVCITWNDLWIEGSKLETLQFCRAFHQLDRCHPSKVHEMFPTTESFFECHPFFGGRACCKNDSSLFNFFQCCFILGNMCFFSKSPDEWKKKPVAEGIFTTPATKDFFILRPRNQKIDPKNDGPWKLYLRLQAWRHFGALKLLDFRGVV